MIRKAMFLRLQRGWSNLIKLLMVTNIITDEKKKKKRAWKSYYQKLLNIEFVRDRNSLS